MMKKALLIFLLVLSYQFSFSQSSNFILPGNWHTTAISWSAGVPDASTSAVISASCSITSNAECLDLTINIFGSTTISSGTTLTVNGNLKTPNLGGGITNNGTLLLKGDLYKDSDLQLEIGGSITLSSTIENNSSGQIITAE